MRPNVIDFMDRFLPHWLSATIAPSWFTMVGLAGVVTLFAMMRVARRNHVDPIIIVSAVLCCYVLAVAAGIVVPMLIDLVQQKIATGSAGLRWSGMTSFWGYLAGMFAVAIVCRDNGLRLARMGDMSTAPLGIALAFARVGCFLGGCDYGKVTSLPWAVRFPTGSPAWHDHVAAGLVPSDRGASLPVHPTQLYEAALGIAIACVAVAIAKRPWAKARDGRVFLVGAALYALGRIGVEALRGDAGRGIYLGLSSGQIFSLIVLATIGLGVLATRKRVLHAITITAIVLLVIEPHVADAQPAPATPPAPAPTTTPPPTAPAPTTAPATTPAPATAPAPAQGIVTAPAGPVAYAPMPMSQAREPFLTAGVLLGLATPLNRRADQVAPLAGPSISVGYLYGPASFWLDLDSYGNKDASHGTLLISSGYTQRFGLLAVGARGGVGPTLVNFHDPVFRDVTGTTVRFEALGEYDINNTDIAIWVRPITIDILTAPALGGPITTYEVRAGIAYRFGGRRPQPMAPPRTASIGGAR